MLNLNGSAMREMILFLESKKKLLRLGLTYILTSYLAEEDLRPDVFTFWLTFFTL